MTLPIFDVLSYTDDSNQLTASEKPNQKRGETPWI